MQRQSQRLKAALCVFWYKVVLLLRELGLELNNEEISQRRHGPATECMEPRFDGPAAARLQDLPRRSTGL